MHMATLTTRVSDKIKAGLDAFCEEQGLKQQAVIEEALASWLEDAADLALMEKRRTGPWESWTAVRKRVV